MFVTEEQAKKLWCPFTRVALVAGMSANRSGVEEAGLKVDGRDYGNVYEETRCLGTGCMLWESKDTDLGNCGLSTKRIY